MAATRYGAAAVRVVGLVLLMVAGAAAQAPDVVLVNGKVVTVDTASAVHQGIAVRDGRITALGSTGDIRRLAGTATRIIDLQGRTVIPGLIDSHLHAIRAALSFSTEVNWTGVRSLREALGRITAAAKAKPAGSWLIVAGGWNELQFAERRRPTPAELEQAAPDNPVYVQLGYGWIAMTDEGFAALGITDERGLPPGAQLERNAAGTRTGAITGNNAAIVALFDRLPRPTFAQQVEGTVAFLRELNRLGMTGAGDPGGNNLAPGDYAALLDVWRHGRMTVRIAYTLGAQGAPGSEFANYKALTSLLPMGFGDRMLKFNGIGEQVTAAMNNNPRPTDADKEAYYQIVKWAAERGLGLTMHWGPDATVDHLLTIFERVNREIPLAPLRWSIAHLNDASVRTLERMKALGVGWTMQDAMYFGGDQALRTSGAEAARRMPPVVTAARLGVHVGAGTDAHRVASYNPFTALQWLLDGKTVSGTAMRGPEETPSRTDALRFYSLGSAWFSHDDAERGSLEVGKLADLAVLSEDYLTIPVDRIGLLESQLTMVGGKVVYAAGPFAPLGAVPSSP